jgi:hypothetical protein
MRAELWLAFLGGYTSLRPVPEYLERFKQVNRLAEKLGTMAYICGRLTLRRGIEPIDEHNILQRVDEVRQMLAELPADAVGGTHDHRATSA